MIELRDLAHDITNNLLTGFPSPKLAEAIDALTTADGVIAVTPIFSTSYSGLFKSFIDVIDPDALTDMPVLIAATGGTERHSLALDYAIRPLFAYLHAVVVPTGGLRGVERLGEHRRRVDRRTPGAHRPRGRANSRTWCAHPTAPRACAIRSRCPPGSARWAASGPRELRREPGSRERQFVPARSPKNATVAAEICRRASSWLMVGVPSPGWSP